MSSEHGGQHYVNYFAIFGALCVCTALSVLFDWWNPDSRILLVFLVMSVAIAKALFVMTYFMHLKFEGNWKFLLLAPTVALAMGIPLALLPDIGLHYYTLDVPQVHENAAHHGEEPPEEHAEPHGEHE